jgi:hypothetical protein
MRRSDTPDPLEAMARQQVGETVETCKQGHPEICDSTNMAGNNVSRAPPGRLYAFPGSCVRCQTMGHRFLMETESKYEIMFTINGRYGSEH